MLLHTCIDHDPRRTFIDFGVKGQGHIWTWNFLPFPRDNSISFWHTMMILQTCIDHDPRRTSIDFGVKRSKVKVVFVLCTFYHFRMITPSPFAIQRLYFTHVLTMTQGGPLLILGSKGQGRICTFNFLPFPHNNSISFWHTMMILHTCIDHSPRRASTDFGVQRSRSYFDFELFAVSAWKLYFFLAYTCIDHDPRRTSIDFGVKRSKVKVIFGLATFSMSQGGPILILGSRG